ncbi:CDP-alcohol phosphatidyltransferase family protein [Persephonella atlantica]|uniref:CDP-alcohol phosphatidyltransferase family protein n=1 Tax=Persephonella atlantica TaxID=2699429 RepID=A0ABS1GJ73_9AQUI|nr:CDP-alcohol phosphatidyltransferase family protein [Persephonella atlantica]MBK3332972.1 CDP-alcohol phosphatidyltransferase family protein [Persephonella atlantica]
MSQIVKQIKPAFEELVFPLVKVLHKVGITPNMLTVSGLLLVSAGSYFIMKGKFLTGALFLIAGNLCDAMDGILARRFNRHSKFGAFLDSVIDRISDFLPLMAIGLFFIKNEIMLILAIYTGFVSFMVSYTRARAEGLGIDCKVGALERTERSVILILTLLFDIVLIGLISIAIGATITVFQRIYCVYRNS